MVVVGGAALDGSGELADVWVLRKQGAGWAWSAPARQTPYSRLGADGQPAGEAAPPLARTAAAIAVVSSELFVLGGEDKCGLVTDACCADLGNSQVCKCFVAEPQRNSASAAQSLP